MKAQRLTRALGVQRRTPPLSVHDLELSSLYGILNKGFFLRLYAHELVPYDGN